MKKKLLYILSCILLIAGFGNLGNNFEGGLGSILVGINLILCCQSHTGFISRLSGKPRYIKEFLPLTFLILLWGYIFGSFSKEFIVEQSSVSITIGILYIIYYLSMNIKQCIK